MAHSAAERIRKPSKIVMVVFALWMALALGMGVRSIVRGKRTVVQDYRHGAHQWMKGEDLYSSSGMGFVYLPQSAMLYVPLSLLPLSVNEVLWRLIIIGAFALALYRFCRIWDPFKKNNFFLLATPVALLLAFDSIRTGQMNLPVAACLMYSIALVHERNWWGAAFAAVLGIALKPTALPLFLLLALLYPAFCYRSIPLLVALAIVPFLTQNPDYAFQQYHSYVRFSSDAMATTEGGHWASLYGMFRQLGLGSVSPAYKTYIGVFMGVNTALVCLYVRKRFGPSECLFLTFTLGMCYTMLFNPRNENNSYCLLAPSLGVLFAHSLTVEKSKAKAAFYSLIVLTILGSFVIGTVLTPGNRRWAAPLATLVFTQLILVRIVVLKRDLQAIPRAAVETGPPSSGPYEIAGSLQHRHEEA